MGSLLKYASSSKEIIFYKGINIWHFLVDLLVSVLFPVRYAVFLSFDFCDLSRYIMNKRESPDKL